MSEKASIEDRVRVMSQELLKELLTLQGKRGTGTVMVEARVLDGGVKWITVKVVSEKKC